MYHIHDSFFLLVFQAIRFIRPAGKGRSFMKEERKKWVIYKLEKDKIEVKFIQSCVAYQWLYGTDNINNGSQQFIYWDIIKIHRKLWVYIKYTLQIHANGAKFNTAFWASLFIPWFLPHRSIILNFLSPKDWRKGVYGKIWRSHYQGNIKLRGKCVAELKALAFKPTWFR